MIRTVAALYIDPAGRYPEIPGVDAWSVARDARLYPGPHPVVAHPPCSAWSKLFACRGTRTRPGQGDDTGIIAVAQVHRFGGIIEQPASSALWRACYLPAPGHRSLWGGFTIEIDQAEWGSPMTKPTWLYIVGTDRRPRPPFPGRRGTTVAHQTSTLRHLTPPLLAYELVEIARSVRAV